MEGCLRRETKGSGKDERQRKGKSIRWRLGSKRRRSRWKLGRFGKRKKRYRQVHKVRLGRKEEGGGRKGG